MKKLLITLTAIVLVTTAISTYDLVKYHEDVPVINLETPETDLRAVSVSTTAVPVTKNKTSSYNTDSFKAQISALSDNQLQELYFKELSKSKLDTSLHIGDFSQEQLPEISPVFWPRAYTPTVHAFASTTVPTGRRPAEVYYAYGIDKIKSKGEGQTIAIVVPAGSETLVDDINTYSKYFGLPNANIKFLYPQGVPTVHNDSWALETTLDATMVHMVAPNATILMVVCNTSAISGLVQGIDAAVASDAKIISLSWGSVEWSNQISYSARLTRPGVIITSATGDSGYGTSWPSTEAGVVAVGGTQLVSSGTTGTVVEQVWTHSTGGISKYYSIPSWQIKAQTTKFRTVPDLSINAVGYTIYMSNFNGQKGYINSSGTSASSPIVAGLIALGLSTRTTAIPADIHPTLYTNSNAYIKDIIGGTIGTGTNAVLGTATSGYDYATGLGVPNAPAFVNQINK